MSRYKDTKDIECKLHLSKNTENSPQVGGSSVPSRQSWMESHTQEVEIHFPSSQRNWSGGHVRPAVAQQHRRISMYSYTESTQQVKCKLTIMSLFLTLSLSSRTNPECSAYHRREDSHHCCLHSCCSHHTSFQGKCRCWCGHTWSGHQDTSCQLERKIRTSTKSWKTHRDWTLLLFRKVDIITVFFFSQQAPE